MDPQVLYYLEYIITISNFYVLSCEDAIHVEDQHYDKDGNSDLEFADVENDQAPIENDVIYDLATGDGKSR